MQKLTLMVLLLQRVDTNFLSYAIADTQKYPYIASMGVYVFKRDALLNLLK
jgi:glucose-1-phosphate adenylyltransferase